MAETSGAQVALTTRAYNWARRLSSVKHVRWPRGLRWHAADRAAYLAALRTPLDLETGPLFRVLHRATEAGDRVLLTMTHAITDGGGLFQAAKLLAEAYRGLGEDPAFALPTLADTDRSLRPPRS